MRTLRLACAVAYVVMAVWLIGAGIRRQFLVAAGVQLDDPAPWASIGIGVLALALFAVTAVTYARRRRRLRARLEATRVR